MSPINTRKLKVKQHPLSSDYLKIFYNNYLHKKLEVAICDLKLIFLPLQKLPGHILHDAAVPVVFDFYLRVVVGKSINLEGFQNLLGFRWKKNYSGSSNPFKSIGWL